MGFRMGVLVGGLAVAVVALAAAVVIVLVSDGGDPAQRRPSTTSVKSDSIPCRVTESGGAARLDLSRSGLSCDEGQYIQRSFARQARAGVGGDLEVGEWTCSQEAFAEYPILTRCLSTDGRELDVVGLAPSAHMSPTEVEAAELESERHNEPTKPKVARAQFFYTPSHNIGCALTPESVRCDIRNKSWTPPPKPNDCITDWGNSVSVSVREGAHILCAGDTLLTGSYGELPYGRFLRRGEITCISRSAGLTCSNGEGSGFFLSFQRLTLF